MTSNIIPKATDVPQHPIGVRYKQIYTPDMVNHPPHYTEHPSGVECIEVTKHYDFCVGNAIKYLWRAGQKKDANKSDVEKEIEDLKKAIWYINCKISILNGKVEE